MSSPLREQMIMHMKLRNYSDTTITSYVQAVVMLVRHYGLPPEQITNEMIQHYLIHRLEEQHIAWNTNHLAMYGIRYLYVNILKRDFSVCMPPGRKKRRKLPQALSREEVKRLFEVTDNCKHRTILMTLYGTGMRIFEVVRLKACHIESDRGLIRIECGKGQKDRYALLPDRLLDQLRLYWRAYRPQEWLFPGMDPNRPIRVETVGCLYRQAKKKAGITRGQGPHTLRHSFATHLLEDGCDMVVIKQLLGHRNVQTTAIYTHVSRRRLEGVKSPLDTL
jgi:site-specific recombinase XerD